MKKLILSAVAVFAFGFMNAQEVNFGVKAGANFSNFTGDDIDSDGKTGFYVGGLADISISENFHFQPEVLYSNEGADEAKLDYIRVPLMAKYYIIENLSILAGPTVAFKIAAEDDFMDEATKSIDFGLAAGASYDIAGGFFAEVRYNFGLANISDVDGGDIKNSNFQVGIGYKF